MPQLTTNEQTIQSMYDLICYAFNKTKDPQTFKAYQILAQNSHTFGKTTKKIVTNQAMAINLHTTLFNKQLKTAGIGYVASYPEARGQGGIKKIFEEIFNYLHHEKITLSYLAPFSQTFYRKLGYENTIWQKTYLITNKSWPFLIKQSNSNFKRITWSDEKELEIIKSLYNQYASKKHGNMTRKNWWWEYLKLKKPNREFAILFDANNNPQAYLSYEMNTSFQIIELVYDNFASLCKLLEFAARHSATFEDFTYTGPVSEDLTACFTENQFITVQLKPYMMARIIDFKYYYEQVKDNFICKEPLTINITDKYCPWNNQIFTLNPHNCQKTSNMEAELNGDIATWSAIFTGCLPLKQAFEQGLISGNEKAIDKLIIPNIPLTLLDYF